MEDPNTFWCVCADPAGNSKERCAVCGAICPTSSEQDRETQDALADIARGKTRLATSKETFP